MRYGSARGTGHLGAPEFAGLFVGFPLRLRGQLPLREQLQQQLQRGVQEAVVHVVDLAEQEGGEAEQNVFPPVWEVHQQTLEGILCDVAQLVVHVDGEPGNERKSVKANPALTPFLREAASGALL